MDFEDLERRLKKFDIFPKSSEDVIIPSKIGTIVSLFALMILIFLFLKEKRSYSEVTRISKFGVDVSSNEFMDIEFSITFPSLSCSILTLDTFDSLGGGQFNVLGEDVFKISLDSKGTPIRRIRAEDDVGSIIVPERVQEVWEDYRHDKDYCGSCYGAQESETQCCNTCDQVIKAWSIKGWKVKESNNFEQCYRERMMGRANVEGCKIEGKVTVPKVKGMLVFAPGNASRTVFQFHERLNDFKVDRVTLMRTFCLDHEIHYLAFGKRIDGLRNPLDGYTKSNKDGDKIGTYKYFVEAVMTMRQVSRKVVDIAYQYAFSEHFMELDSGASSMDINTFPGMQIRYDINPLFIHMRDDRMSFVKFITHICGVLGGVFVCLQLSFRFIEMVIRMAKRVFSPPGRANK